MQIITIPLRETCYVLPRLFAITRIICRRGSRVFLKCSNYDASIMAACMCGLDSEHRMIESPQALQAFCPEVACSAGCHQAEMHMYMFATQTQLK